MPHSLKQIARGICVLVASCVLWAEATASPLLTFESSPSTAQVSWAGGSNPLVTTFPVAITSVSGVDTPLNAGPLNVINGALSFTTGALQSIFSVGETRTWFFAGGGQIQLLGGIPALGIAEGSALLTGVFDADAVSVSGDPASVGNSAYSVTGTAAFTDLKDTALLGHFGLPVGDSFAGGFTFSAVLVPAPTAGAVDDAFQSTAVTAFSMFNVPASVPEPGTLALLGLGLAGLAAARRRRQ